VALNPTPRERLRAATAKTQQLRSTYPLSSPDPVPIDLRSKGFSGFKSRPGSGSGSDVVQPYTPGSPGPLKSVDSLSGFSRGQAKQIAEDKKSPDFQYSTVAAANRKGANHAKQIAEIKAKKFKHGRKLSGQQRVRLLQAAALRKKRTKS